MPSQRWGSSPRTSKAQMQGFSLMEMMIALALATALALTMGSMVRPWLEMRNSLETESRLASMGSALASMYELAAFSMETPPPAFAGEPGWMALGSREGHIISGFVTGSPLPLAGDSERLQAFTYLAGGALADQLPVPCNTSLTQAFWRQQGSLLGMGVDKTARDGSGAAFCLAVGPERTSAHGSINLVYRQLYVLTPGKNGKWESGSVVDPVSGGLQLQGDDRGVVVSGLPIQLRKFQITQDRVSRIARLYERYFAMRYLSSNTRDLLRNYFIDPDGVVGPAVLGAAYASGDYETLRADQHLQPLGVVGQDALNAWEIPTHDLGIGMSNAIYVGNQVDGIAVTQDEQDIRVPAAGAAPPYSALIFTFLPGMQTYGVHAFGRY